MARVEEENFKSYSEYKDTDIEWIDKIPNGWELVKLKYVCSTVADYGKNIPSDDYAKEGVRFIRTTDINNRGEILDKDPVYVPKEKLRENDLLLKGDILFSRSGSIGQTYLHEDEGSGDFSFAGYLVRFSPKKELSPKFLFYFSKTNSFDLWLNTQLIESTIGNVNGSKYANMQIPFPPISEQKTIVKFLDRETSKIDRLIEKQEKLIDLLEEKRATLITEKVTKGLDPDVEMKNTGVDWLGKVPAHWELERLKFLVIDGFKYGANRSPQSYHPDYPRYIRITDITQNGSLREDTKKSLKPTFAAPYLLKEHDILLARRGATVGKTFLYQSNMGEACFAGYLIRVRLNKEKLRPELFKYFTETRNYWEWINTYLIQSTIENVSAEKYANLIVPIPPQKEQRRILRVLDKRTSGIAETENKIKNAIKYLKEYRTALISAAVTGKIDVRGVDNKVGDKNDES